MPIQRPVAASGAAATLLVITGLIVSVAAGRPETTLASSDAEIADALRDAAGSGVWAGVALESAGLLLLLVFAAGLARAAGDTIFARASVHAATAFVAVSLPALGAGALLADQAGPGADMAVAGVLNDLFGGLYAVSWAACGAFLVLIGIALRSADALPRAMSIAAIVIGAASLVATAAPESEAGQAIGFLPWVWVVAASVVLVRRYAAASSTTARNESGSGVARWST
jgi:hypothetical protein